MSSSNTPRKLDATIGDNELPNVEDARARLSRVMQDGVAWIMAQEMAEAGGP